MCYFRRGSRIFERGGSRRGYRIFHKHPPPPSWALSAWWRHPPSEKLKNTPTLGHSQTPPPPPWTLPVWRHPHSKGGRGNHPCHTHTLDPPLGSILGLQAKKGGGSNFGPNVKKPTSWPKRGGPDPLDPPPPPPGSATVFWSVPGHIFETSGWNTITFGSHNFRGKGLLLSEPALKFCITWG